MSASVSSASNNISEVVERLRRLTLWDAQSGWRYYDSDLAVVKGVNICNWPVAELNHKGHIAWPSGKQVFYLGQKFVVPPNLSAYPVTGLRLLLSLTWWADHVQIFVNGELVGVGDLFDCAVRLLLSPSVLVGDEFLVILRLVSPGHDSGALVKSVCVYEAADSVCFDPGFVADELEILQNSLSGNFSNLNSQYSPTRNIVHGGLVVKGETLKSQVELAVGLIDWSVVGDRQKFDRSLSSLRQNLLGFLGGFQDGLKVETAEGAEGAEGGGRERVFGRAESDESTSIYIGECRGKSSIYKGKIYLVGHAHLDLAWLWPVAETWEVAQRTFESALKLQSEFPSLIFCHSTPALYAWIEEHRPDLFAEIKKQVVAGLWEVVGGMWVEPDLNLISAESMVRQVVYGQRYAQEKFGELMRVVWLPDTFGFGWQLPQILRDGGVDYFVTQKLRWNDTTEFPYGAFWWEGLDGTKIFSMMSGPIGENIESVKMANHLFDWQIKTGLQSAVWLPGVGDHGGGPTRDMLEVAKRWELSPFFPRLEFVKAVDYLALIESQFSPVVSQSQADVSIGENQPIGKQAELGNLSVAESVKLGEISQSQADVSMRDNSAAVESANLGETSPSQADVSMAENQPILKQSEIGNSAAVESANLGETSEFPVAVSMGDNSAAVESANLGETSEFPVAVSMGDNSAAVESANLGETSEFPVAVSMGDNSAILKQGEIGNSAVVESANLGETSPSQADVSMLPLLPLWKDELYLEFHRGCYTTHADQKRYNRRCEELLYQAELLSSLATICAGAIYPKSELEIAWKKVLFNQFHDILPGSSIAQVYTDANLGWAEVDRTCRSIVLTSLDAIASQISLPSPPKPDAQPILIFNSLNWSRSEVVSLSLPDSAATTWAIYDLSGQRLTTQIQPCDRLQPQSTLLFLANNLPPVGYRVFWLCPEAAETLETSSPLPDNHDKTWLGYPITTMTRNEASCQETPFIPPIMLLENEFIRVKVDSETGNLSSIWDKLNHREVLNESGGNQLQSFQDSGQYWDAWNIDPNYAKHPLAAPILKDITWISQGEIRQSLRVVRQIGKSEFYQDYIVEIGSPVLKIKTVVDWQEKQVLVKAAFGLNVEADLATCEIPGGAIERTTKPQTAAEKAKWEVPILRWTDISNDDFGVSILNDCKYGCDLQPNQIRLTLLRSSTWPDEQADIGIHEFTCGVYPHRGNWQNAGTVQQGYELNLPLLVKVFPKLEENHHRTLPTVGKFLDLSAENLVLMAFKQSEDHANLWILRCYESQGKEARLELESDLSLAISQSVDLLEQPTTLPEKSEDGKGFQISPWKIASFSIAYGDNK
ncbi:MAG: glycoside hydrolase family 38 C-terminal domain-containing protein [Microcoleus anatoxicus]|uniref:alpha-mannosidase n=1 Tax=Microcoleus anatoxicus TaxID=2705319 RepID=UPI003671FBD4